MARAVCEWSPLAAIRSARTPRGMRGSARRRHEAHRGERLGRALGIAGRRKDAHRRKVLAPVVADADDFGGHGRSAVEADALGVRGLVASEAGAELSRE